jgi:hypothetical protein
MTEKLTTCATCGTPLEPREGPGRPSVYCGEPCRRAAEYRLRSLAKRIDSTELELRRLLAERPGFGNPDERRRRVRLLRKWIAEDTAKMHALLGVPVAEPAAKGRR